MYKWSWWVWLLRATLHVLSQPDCVLTNWNCTPWAEHGRATYDKDLTWQFYSHAVDGGLEQQKGAWGTAWQRPVLFLLPLQQERVNALVKKTWKAVFSCPFSLSCFIWAWLDVKPSVFLLCLKYWQTNCVLVILIHYFWKIFLLSFVGYFAFHIGGACILYCELLLMLCCRLAWNVLLSSLV